ncbi:MAG: signal peptide peptidase SppA [Pseudomonadales bacterium]
MSEPSVLSRIGRGLTRARIFTANLIFVVLIVIVLAAVLSGSGGIEVPEGSALVLNPEGSIVDQESFGDSITDLISPQPRQQEAALGELVTAVERATEDDRITTLVLDLNQLSYVSTAHTETLGEAFSAFRAEEKEIIAFGSYFSQPQYLLATYADAVYMHPYGQILPTGAGINQLYFSELLKKLDVNIHIFRVGKYKAFVEPYTRVDMSDDARKANQNLIDSLWSHYSDRVIGNRKLEPGAFVRYVDEFDSLLADAGGDMARLALEFNLIDELLTPDQARVRIADRVGYADKGNYNGIDYRSYLAATDAAISFSADAKVGVITARGAIVMGSGGRGVIAADSLIGLIRQARDDDSIAALVLRVDSPGGSAFASELIRQELELTQLAGKPVVVSMGNVAASGGYWISATANRIFARSTTITGSIGIFALIPTFEDSLARIGISTDGVGSSPLSRTLDPLTGVNEPMARILQANIENGYERFINLVARGRDMTPEAVEKVAQGRVWIGDEALNLGLVDQLGGLHDAIESAAELAELDDYDVEHIAAPLSTQELLLRQIIDNAQVSGHVSDSPLFSALSDAWRLFNSLNDPGHSYALCEACGLLR